MRMENLLEEQTVSSEGREVGSDFNCCVSESVFIITFRVSEETDYI